jgi:hypothetical protein
MNTEDLHNLTDTGKLTVAVTLMITDEDDDLFRRAGIALYGEDHPVSPSAVIRELAKRGCIDVLKNPPRR